MKMELSKESFNALYFMGLISHSNEEHRLCHVATNFDKITKDGLVEFECIDCGIIFQSYIHETTKEEQIKYQKYHSRFR